MLRHNESELFSNTGIQSGAAGTLIDDRGDRALPGGRHLLLPRNETLSAHISVRIKCPDCGDAQVISLEVQVARTSRTANPTAGDTEGMTA